MNIRVCTRLSGEKAAYIIVYIVLGMINDTSKDKMWSIGSNESAAGQGKAIHV